VFLVAGIALLIATSIAFAPAAVSSTGAISTGAISTGSSAEPRAARTPSPSRNKVERAEPRSESTLVVASSDASCARARRKLWVEGEGWMVRKVAVCR
jgi:hypothetical protein